MNIAVYFQELDDLIVKNTTPPATAKLRHKLHSIQEQLEAYVAEKEKITLELSQLKQDKASVVSAIDKPNLDANATKVLKHIFDR